VTRLGLWLRGPWPSAGGTGSVEGSPEPRSANHTNHTGRTVVEGPSVIDRIVDLVGMAERSGFDSVWVTDEDPLAVPETPDPGLEAYSLLGALAARTEGVRLGALPVGIDNRAPSIVAKIVTGIDVISHGRGILTYGLGADDAVRGARVTEALRVGRALLEDEAPTFDGAFYSVVDAKNKPGPVQVGGIPVVVSIGGLVDLTTVAVSELTGLADAVVLPGRADDVRRAVARVRSSSPPTGVRPNTGVGPLQLIGIGPMAPATPSSRPEGGSTVPGVAAEVRALFDAGVDGCIVPVAITTPPGVLADIAAGLGGTASWKHPLGGDPAR
jgi:hypothetical protein